MKRVFVIALAMTVLGSLSSVVVAHHGGRRLRSGSDGHIQGDRDGTDVHQSPRARVLGGRQGRQHREVVWVADGAEQARESWVDEGDTEAGRPDRGDGDAT